MARRRKARPQDRSPNRSSRAERRSLPPEGRTAEIITVGWLLSLLTTLVLQAGSLAALLWPEGGARLQFFGAYLLWTSALFGVATLLLTGLAWRLRRLKPPRVIVAVALAAGIGPLLVLLVLQLRS